MYAIIAGGRTYNVGPRQRRWLDGIHAAMTLTLVVSGGAPGADAGGERWAVRRSIRVKRFPADWAKHGTAAGPVRNRAMAEFLAAGPYKRALCVLFPGGRGTANMKAIATELGLRVIEYRDLES